VLSFVDSIFAGSFSHALAEIYAGEIPCAKRAFAKGVERKWDVYCYKLFLYLIIAVAIALFAILSGSLDISYSSPAEVVSTVVPALILNICMTLLATLMTAAIPSIIVENKSPIQALKRSYHLCKNFVGFIFCSQFCFQIGLLIATILIYLILDDLPVLLRMIGRLVVNLGIGICGPV
jgi:hypothetical protein